MNERYSILCHETSLYWVKNCPVTLVSHALTKDNINGRILAQCKFESHIDKPIKALYICLHCFDTAGQGLPDAVRYEYLDLNVRQYTLFGDKMAIPLPEVVRAYSVVLERIIFHDNSIWENQSGSPFAKIDFHTRPMSELGGLEAQYRRELQRLKIKKQHTLLPEIAEDYKRCGCGRFMLPGETGCPDCGAVPETLVTYTETAYLEAQKEAFEQRQQQEQAKQEAARQEQEQKQRRRKKAAALAAAAAGLVAVFAVVLIRVIIPAVRYNSASKLFEAGQYAEAQAAFEALDGFTDASDRAVACRYRHAGALQASGAYEEAVRLFDELEGYEDSAARRDECAFSQAKILFEKEEYKRALNYFEMIESPMDLSEYYEVYTIVSEHIEVQNSDGTIDITEYKYDEYGNAVRTQYASGKYYEHQYTYDDLGNILTDALYSEDGYICTTSYAYDATGNVVVEKRESKHGADTTRYTYDADGNVLLSETEYSGVGHEGGEDRITYEYTYDSNGNVKTLKRDVTLGSLIQHSLETNTYDEYGNLIYSEQTEAGEEGTTVVYEYDDQSNPVRIERSNPDGGRSISVYAYDEFGRRVCEKVMCPSRFRGQ